MLRETVANVVRHSGGRTCRIGIACAGGEIAIDVEDDGRGLPPAPDPDAQAAASGAAGLGLASIERRARKLGGQHRFAVSRLGGLRVQVTAPLDGGPAGETPQAP